MAVMGTAKNPDLGHAHRFMDGRAVKGVSLGRAVMGGSLGTAVMGGTRVESRGQVATLVTMITGTVAQRAETKTPEAQNPEAQTPEAQSHVILHTGDY